MNNPQIYLSRGAEGCQLAVAQQGVAIVVDALRASVTIATLFAHGVTRILVVGRVEDARALACVTPDALLVGERGGERIAGFDLGNSPLEVLASPSMAGRTAIFTSSNGAQRLTGCTGTPRILVGGMANVTTLTDWIRAHVEQTGCSAVCIAAGQYPDEDFISPEDEAVGAYISQRIGYPIAESSQSTFLLWQQELAGRKMEEIFRDSPHAQRLMSIGYAEDVRYCARPDTAHTLPIVTGPVWLEGRQIGVEVQDLRSR